ncbi:MAG TPA: hypothetical protein VF691_12245 [Cytophagaceae bacterium]|jgi:hypothetical protein
MFFKLKPFFVFLYLILISLIVQGSIKNDLVRQAIVKYSQLEKVNKVNERQGNGHLNNYLIELDPNWIEEKPSRYVLSAKYDVISRDLIRFNSARSDKLRFYVIVVSDYQGVLDETIDPTKLPDKITNLSDLLASTSKEADLLRMKKELAEIPQRIEEAMKKKGYDERVIYFFGLIKLYRLDKQPRHYKQDFISLKGGRLLQNQELIRNLVKENLSSTPKSDLQVQEIVRSIIHSVEVVVDGKEVTDNSVLCADNLEQLVSKTAKVKEAKLQETITGFAQLIDNGSSSNQLGSPYLLVDDVANFLNSDFFTKNVLPDKLSLLANNNNSSYKLYVVFQKVDFALTQEGREKLAEEIYKKSSKAKQSGSLIMVVPYYQTFCTGQSWFLAMPVNKETAILMPAVAGSNASLVDQMNSDLTGVTTPAWKDKFDNAFKNIPKKYTAYAFTFEYNGELIYHGKIEKTGVTGKENIVEVLLAEDERFDEISKAHLEYTGVATANAYPGSPQQTENILAAAEKYQQTVLAITSSPANFKLVNNLNLVGSKITKDLAWEFCRWYGSRKKVGALATFTSPESEIFYGGTNPLNVQDALLLIDIGSGVASLVALDIVFESIGAYYAYSNGQYAEAAMYAGATAIPLLSPAVRRGLVEGSTFALKTLKGTYVVRPRNILGCGYFFEIENNFSPFLKNALEYKKFVKLTKYKSEKEFIEKFEDGLLKSEDYVTRVNNNPELIDEYNAYYKKEKGDWEAFLTSKELKTSKVVSRLTKVENASSLHIPWKNLDDKNIIWASADNIELYTAKTFADEFGNSMYDIVLNDRYYVKMDLTQGRILLGGVDGTYHAFAILDNTLLASFKKEILNVTEVVFEEKLTRFIVSQTEKLKVLCGIKTKPLNLSGKLINISSSKTTTLLGRYYPDLMNVFNELGSFKNVGLGETMGGLNLLNKPNHYYDKATWWNAYNKPWLDRAISRGDDIYLATEVRFDKLYDLAKKEITSYGYELKLLVDSNYKPQNLTSTQWEEAKEVVMDVFKNNE